MACNTGHTIWEPVRAPAALPLIESLLILSRKAMEDEPSPCAPATEVGDPKKTSWFLASAWPSPSPYSHLGNKPADGRFLSPVLARMCSNSAFTNK